jgi:hypothetical protein
MRQHGLARNLLAPHVDTQAHRDNGADDRASARSSNPAVKFPVRSFTQPVANGPAKPEIAQLVDRRDSCGGRD